MSDRKKAIETLKQLRLDYEEFYEEHNNEVTHAYDMAIASLETDEAYNLMYEQSEFCKDCISREQAIKEFCKQTCETPNCRFRDKGVVHASCDEVDVLKRLPSVLPKADKSIIYCRDCKWWKESDGTYKRGVRAESKCLMNTKVIYEGNGYCYLAEPKEESEDNK